MRITHLTLENIKRITAVDITPGDGTLIVVGGKNGAGKSSVLDAIMYAIGGQSASPSEPIRAGEAEAKIVVELDDLIVTRKFKRDRIHEDCINVPTVVGVCHCTKFGPTTSTLVVTNKDGARYPTPQAILDKLYGKLTFDPLAFASMDAKAQRGLLTQLVGLDTSDLEQQKLANANERTLVNREVKALEGQLTGLPEFPGVEGVDVAALMAELEEANASLRRVREAETAVAAAEQRLQHSEQTCQNAYRSVEQIDAEISALARKREQAIQDSAAKTDEWERLQAEVTDKKTWAAQLGRIDPAPIQQQIKSAESVNAKVRSNRARADVARRLELKRAASKGLTENLAKVEAERAARLVATQFPIPGLGITDEGVTFGGIPFEQASSSERLKVSVAIGLAANPKLRVLLIRNGNLLDTDSLAQLAEQIDAAGAQVWMEFVTSSADGMAVMIEDGHVAG